jgi:hypothetical protein
MSLYCAEGVRDTNLPIPASSVSILNKLLRIFTYFEQALECSLVTRKLHPLLIGKVINILGAVCGNVFASPSAAQVRRGIELLDNEKG